MNDMSTDWLNGRCEAADLQPDNFLQPHRQGQGPTFYAGPCLTDSSTPSWLFGNGTVATEFGVVPACAQPTEITSGHQHDALLPADTHCQTAQQFIQGRQDEVPHGSMSGSGSGSTACPSKPASSGKRSQAWNAKNRRAQKKFREKQKVPLKT